MPVRGSLASLAMATTGCAPGHLKDANGVCRLVYVPEVLSPPTQMPPDDQRYEDQYQQELGMEQMPPAPSATPPPAPPPIDPGEFFPITDPGWAMPESSQPHMVATNVYPKGDSMFTTKQMIREGPFHYENPTSGYDDLIGVGNNPGGIHGRNPFYNVDDDLTKTQFNERWTAGGRLLPSSYEDYIVPLTDIIGYPGPKSDWSARGMPRDYGPVVQGVIPPWYGLDINSFGGYEDENKYWNTPEGQYQPDDFSWQYTGGPSFVEGAYSGPSPGLLGMDDEGDPYGGWIPGVDMRGSTNYTGDTKIMWGPGGKGYWIEGQSDMDEYGFNPLPPGPPSSVMQASEVIPGGWGASWVPYDQQLTTISDSITTPLPSIPSPSPMPMPMPIPDNSLPPPIEEYNSSPHGAGSTDQFESYLQHFPPGTYTHEGALQDFLGRPPNAQELYMLDLRNNQFNMPVIDPGDNQYNMPIIDSDNWEPPKNNDGLLGIVGGGLVDQPIWDA